MEARTWCEVDVAQLRDNVAELARNLRSGCLMAPVVKADAYGHGMELAARAFVEGGASWLCVDAASEGARLRAAGFDQPVLVLGYVPEGDLAEALALDLRLTVYDDATVTTLAAAARALERDAIVHVKVETGNNRQGLLPDDALALARRISETPGLCLEGLSTHFADIEDTTDHRFARQQLALLESTASAAREQGLAPTLVHCANSAAAILWPEAHLGLARVGIAAYGMWPSKETFVSARMARRDDVEIRPALCWKTRIAQLKWLPPGDTVGYGRSYQVTRATRLAVLPVGYYDGYDRGLSNLAHVLIGGQRAPVRGRVCMNMVMADVTDIGDVAVGDEVVLLGRQGDEQISAEQLAGWMGTINYEVTTRIGAHVPRLASPGTSTPGQS